MDILKEETYGQNLSIAKINADLIIAKQEESLALNIYEKAKRKVQFMNNNITIQQKHDQIENIQKEIDELIKENKILRKK